MAFFKNLVHRRRVVLAETELDAFEGAKLAVLLVQHSSRLPLLPPVWCSAPTESEGLVGAGRDRGVFVLIVVWGTRDLLQPGTCRMPDDHLKLQFRC